MSNQMMVNSLSITIETEDGEKLEVAWENCVVTLSQEMKYSEPLPELGGKRQRLMQLLSLEASKAPG